MTCNFALLASQIKECYYYYNYYTLCTEYWQLVILLPLVI